MRDGGGAVLFFSLINNLTTSPHSPNSIFTPINAPPISPRRVGAALEEPTINLRVEPTITLHPSPPENPPQVHPTIPDKSLFGQIPET